jgi:hypothetical protein
LRRYVSKQYIPGYERALPAGDAAARVGMAKN